VVQAMVVQRLGGPEVLELVERPIPDPGPGEIRVRVVKTTVNFADIKARHGRYHGAGAPPFIPGLDVLGVVDALGAGVVGWREGERVIALPAAGSYAEYVVADARLVYRVPDGVSDDDAAACPIVGLTAYKLLMDVARMATGEVVLVHAAGGGVGTTAVKLARILGAGLVIGTVGGAAKEGAARAAGADHVVSYAEPGWSQHVRDLTGGRGVDVVLDSVAGQVTAESMLCLAPFGRMVNFGDASGETGLVKTQDLHSSCRAVLGFSLGTTRRHRPELLAGAAAAVMGYLADGRLHMHIGAQFPLASAAEAQRLVESRQSTGKVLLTVAP